ncbi:Alkane hydroxylase MAH1 [Camellia lanceoleosa]|nr:Alkane hydroxylase MAH1 [Camellia lanceoleosa]
MCTRSTTRPPEFYAKPEVLFIPRPIFANMNMLVTVDPSNVHYIMNSNFLNFPKGPQFLKIFDVFGNTFINSDSNMWRNQRKLAQLQLSHPGFHRLLVKTTQDKVEKRLIKVLEHVPKQGLVVDLQDLFQRLTFDSTCILVTSYDPCCLSIDLPHVPLPKPWMMSRSYLYSPRVPESAWKFQSIGHEKKLRNARKTLDHIIEKYISMKRDELSRVIKSNDEEEEGVDMLTLYLNEEEIKSDDKFLRDTVLNFLIVGRDTTSSALTWFLWLVSTHNYRRKD